MDSKSPNLILGVGFMSNEFEKLLKTDVEIEREIIRDFSHEFINEIKKLCDNYGKDGLLKMLREGK